MKEKGKKKTFYEYAFGKLNYNVTAVSGSSRNYHQTVHPLNFFSIYVRQKYVIIVSFREPETLDYERTDNKAKKTRNSTKK